MRIEVLEVIDEAEGQVRFAHKGHIAVGWWRARRPAMPGWFHVELDAPEPLVWGADLVVVEPDDHPPVIVGADEGTAVTLHGELLEVREDGVAVVSLGETALTIETTGPPPADVVGRTVRVGVARLDLFPYDV